MKNILTTIVSNTPLPINGRGWGWVCCVFLLMTGGLHLGFPLCAAELNLGFPLCAAELNLHAQDFGVEYTTELQTDFQKCNFVNLLRLNAEVPISKSVSLEASTISVAKTRGERLVDDLQTFSNIEEDNLPLAIAVCGANWQINDKHSLFMGIRNMNEDYFTSPVTSFFTNSSCGIYPTISARSATEGDACQSKNYPIANYPVASVGMHYCYDGTPIKVQASLYNGTGYNRFTGRDNVFRLCPKGDGVFGLAEVSYAHKGNRYFLGNALYCKERINAMPWFYTEHHIRDNLSLLAGYSRAFAVASECKDFVGFGVRYKHKNCELGVFTDYANFSTAKEFVTEIMLKYNATKYLYVQPILHIISTSFEESAYKDIISSIASLRVGIIL